MTLSWEKIDAIPGWFMFQSYCVWRALLDQQAGVSGDLFEIGVWRGRSASVLASYRKGKYHQAVLEFEKAVRLRGDLHPLAYHLALAYARLANFPRAIQILARLVEDNPGLERAHELLGDLYQMKGDVI